MIKCRINGLVLEFDNVDDLLEYQKKIGMESKVQTKKEKEHEKVATDDKKFVSKHSRKRLTMKQRHEKYEKVRELQKQGMNLTKSVMMVFGYHDSIIHKKYKGWLYRKYGETPIRNRKHKKDKHITKTKLQESHMEKIRTLNRQGKTLKEASLQVYGKRLGGLYYYAYKEWLKKKYGEEPIFHFNSRNLGKGKNKPILTKKVQASVKKPEPKKVHYMSRNHGLFLGFRNKTVKAVMNSMNLPYKQALKYLGTVYKRHTKEEDAIKEVEQKIKNTVYATSRKIPFPEIAYVDKDNEELLIKMLENVIKYPTASLNRRIEGEILGITATWDAFVESFMVKSFAVAEHFGVENRFSLSDTKAISYHK